MSFLDNIKKGFSHSHYENFMNANIKRMNQRHAIKNKTMGLKKLLANMSLYLLLCGGMLLIIHEKLARDMQLLSFAVLLLGVLLHVISRFMDKDFESKVVDLYHRFLRKKYG